MSRTTRVSVAVAALLLATSGAAHAGPVNEAEPNDFFAQAQNIDGYFSLDADPDIANSTTVPHATVIGTGDDTFDLYSFTVPGAGLGSLSFFDIDGGMPSFDSWLRLYRGDGSLLAQNDDNGNDLGSNHVFDARIHINLPSPGLYYIEVGRFCCPVPVPSGASYRLHVSVPGHPTDNTSPELSLPSDLTAEATAPDGATVTYAATATDLVDGSVPVDCVPASGSTFPLGTTPVSCSATDAHGNTTTGEFSVTVQDTTAPALAGMPDEITATATGASGATVGYTPPTATDLVDGSVAVECAPASGGTFAPGATTVTCTATDAAGNTASDSFTVDVRYAFAGFFSPISNGLNRANSGRAVPVKFSLGGNMGLAVLTDGSPSSQEIDCDTSAPVGAAEPSVTAGSSALTYDADGGHYHYVWKTNQAWSGTCRRLTVTLDDGTEHAATFVFSR